MLALDSNRWSTLHTFFGKGADIPDAIRRWRDSLGSPGEADAWADLGNFYTHQMTITDAAFAVTPYLVREFPHVGRERLMHYVADVGVTEGFRQTEGWTVPDDLAPGYNTALAVCKKTVLELLGTDVSKLDFRYALATLGFLCGHPKLGDILFHLDCITADCPKCGDAVFPEEIRASGYV